MSDYIKREDALAICQKAYEERLRMQDYCGDTVAWNIGADIKLLPAADVTPVVRGEWVKVYCNYVATVYECSICHCLKFGTSEYCTCGAKMREPT